MKKPTRADLLAARGRTVPDVVGPELRILFCGINPSLYTAATGHHFARPGNRFWKALHGSGFTPRLLAPEEEGLLPGLGLGITNVVRRATATAAEIGPEEYQEGRLLLEEKVARWSPEWLAVAGVGAYRSAFGRPRATIGRQIETVGSTRIWVLPNPSGLNANYPLDALISLFAELRAAAAADTARHRASRQEMPAAIPGRPPPDASTNEEGGPS